MKLCSLKQNIFIYTDIPNIYQIQSSSGVCFWLGFFQSYEHTPGFSYGQMGPLVHIGHHDIRQNRGVLRLFKLARVLRIMRSWYSTWVGDGGGWVVSER